MSNNLSFGIIGGGPAGLATAICLAERGFEVTLFEKSTFPIDKVCGEGIMLTGVEFLEQHEVLNLISPNDKREFYGVRYVANNAKTLEGKFKSGFGLGIKRTVLSEALYKKLMHFSNVKIYEKSEIINSTTPMNTMRISSRSEIKPAATVPSKTPTKLNISIVPDP